MIPLSSSTHTNSPSTPPPPSTTQQQQLAQHVKLAPRRNHHLRQQEPSHNPPAKTCVGLSLEINTNTATEQHIHLNIDGAKSSVSGSGAGSLLTSLKLKAGTSKVVATFTHGNVAAPKPSAELRAAGPHAFGLQRYLAVAADNGDDDDFDDAVLDIKGFIKMPPKDKKDPLEGLIKLGPKSG